MSCVIAIDPGSASGALVAARDFGMPFVTNLPNSPGEMYALLSKLSRDYPFATVYMENVGGTMPGNSAKSARTFATHMGHLEMACAVTGLPVVKVTPRTWMNIWTSEEAWPSNPRRDSFDDVTGDKEFAKAKRLAKTARKEYIYKALQKLYPALAFTKRQADAVGIMHYATRQGGQT